MDEQPQGSPPSQDPFGAGDVRVWRFLTVVLAIIALGALAFALNAGGSKTGPTAAGGQLTAGGQDSGKRVKVPDVSGKPALEAVETLQFSGLMLGDVTQSTDSTAPAGTVVAQDPAAGEDVDQGALVALTIAAGGELLMVPDVRGLTKAQAVNDIEAAGLTVYASADYNADEPADSVFGQLPQAGTNLAPGSSVGILVSKGPAPATVAVPSVVGKGQADAEATIREAGLEPNPIAAYDPNVKLGTVAQQQPAAKTAIAPGATVAILVSQGSIPSYETVPNVIGKAQADAEAAIAVSGLTPTAQQIYSSTVAKGLVVSQLPAAGSKVAPKVEVGIFVSLGKQPPVTTPVPPPAGPQTAKVPKVTGTTQSQATATLKSAGFGVKTLDIPWSTAKPGTVIQQFPTAGTTVLKGSEVLIGIARAIPKPTWPPKPK